MAVSFCCFLLGDCKKEFTPKLNQTDVSILVVEGYIDGADTVLLKLSRARKIYPGDSAVSKNELHARISIEDDQHNTYPIVEIGNGVYKSSMVLNLNPAYQYRLHFFTSDNKEYVSDFVPYKVSRPIDSIGWDIKNDGLQLYVNTQDPTNNTRYYRWEYTETWEFNSQWESGIMYDPTTRSIVPRTEQVHTCWRSQNSTNILLGSTTTLSNDVVNKAPIEFFPYHDEKLDIIYSTLVKQYALDLAGYNFWQQMKENTEITGSIFDPQPGLISGNIHCVTDPSQKTIGYIGAGATFQKRIFIISSSLPSDWVQRIFCGDSVWILPPQDYHVLFGPPGSFLDPVEPIVSGGNIIGYVGASPICVDCTLTGTNKKPSYWP